MVAAVKGYLKNHIIIACVISIAAYMVARWAGCPVPFFALLTGGLFYVARETQQSGLTMPDGSWKKDWTYPMAATGVLTVLGFIAQLGGLL